MLLDGGKASAQHELDTPGAVPRLDPPGDRFGHAASEQAGQGLDHHHAGAAMPRTRRQLEADEAAADDGERPAGHQLRADPQRIVVSAEIGDPPGRLRGYRQPARHRAGGEQQLVVGEGTAAGERDLLTRAVDAGHRPLRIERYSSRGEPVGGRDGARRRFGIAGHDVLGERRALVGQVPLGPEQVDRPGIALFAQSQRGAHATLARAGNDHAGAHASMNTVPSSTFTG